MEARAVHRAPATDDLQPEQLGEDRFSFEEPGMLADGQTSSDALGLPPEGLGGGRPGKEHGARSLSPPPIREQMLFEMRRAFALYDTGDGTVARADGWRILQTMGEDEHTPEDFEQLLSPRVAAKPSGTVGRLSGGASMLRKSVVEVAAEAGLTPSKGEKGEDEFDSAGLTLRDPFKVSFVSTHAIHPLLVIPALF
jgi:hypothetical protein